MFFIIGVVSGSSDLGMRACGYFPCCGANSVLCTVTCVYQQFTLFFIPLFRFGKRYFISCPHCGAAYEIEKAEGRRIEHDQNAGIDPNKLHRMTTAGPSARFCPHCGAQVSPSDNFCPHCGARL